MTILVTCLNFTTTSYPEGKKWVIDDDGRLHVVGPQGNLSSFNAGSWHSVHHEVVPAVESGAVNYTVGMREQPENKGDAVHAIVERFARERDSRRGGI